MKKIFLTLILLVSALSICNARPAMIVYYIMEQTMDSAPDNGDVKITCKIESPFASLQSGYPQPRLHIHIGNFSNDDIVIDFKKTMLIENGVSTSIAHILALANTSAPVQDMVTIPSQQGWQFTNINFLPHEYINLIPGIYKYDLINGHFLNKRLGQVLCSVTPIDVKEARAYNESNSPLTLEVSVNYRKANVTIERTISTKYYLKCVIGTKVSFKNLAIYENTDIVNNIFPNWNSPDRLHFSMWRNSLKE